jgi:WXG100 family type VII secretion target
MGSPLEQLASDLRGLAGQLRDALVHMERLGGELLAGDPGAIHEAAGAWREMQAGLAALEADLGSQSRRALAGTWEGAASEAYAAEWRALDRGITELAGALGRVASSLEAEAGRAAALNAEARAVMDALRGLAGAVEAAALNPAAAAAVAQQAPQTLGRWRDVLDRVEAESAALLAWLMTLTLLFEHQVREMPRVHPAPVRAVVLPGYPPRLGVSASPGEIALPRPAPRPGPPPDKGSARGVLLAVLLSLAAAGAAAGLRDGLRAITRTEFDRQRKQKAVSQALTAAPRPPLRPEDEERIRRNAEDLNVDPARFESLARDPANGGRVDQNSIEEARLAIRLERSGQLTDVVRSPDPQVDLVEDGGAGQSWDVKSFRRDNFDSGTTIKTIGQEIDAGHHVIINTAHLEPAQVAEIQRLVGARGWSGQVIFASSE